MARPHPVRVKILEIMSWFESLSIRSFTYTRLHELIEGQKEHWGIPYFRSSDYVIDFLVKEKHLKKTVFNGNKSELEIYSLNDLDFFSVVSGIKSGSYYTCHSALFLNGLTLQIPKVYYLNAEHQSVSRISDTGPLTQEAINNAFSKPQRLSNNIYEWNDRKVVLLNGKNTKKLGVVEKNSTNQAFAFTDLEKTLIDCAVRPVYSGGVSEVLNAFEAAKDQLDVEKLVHYLGILNYKYPYRQAIGFYLERAGYEDKQLRFFDSKSDLDFYLTYEIKNKEYSHRWAIYYPKGF
ncbi:type IV toxin-antitoxin system AbiEi family antitoxin domain-containing protein [Pedobacter sp. R-06]|uniref:type IV toxin-antitoxin system AbiEi family antitoxin domain-containing protein n=1 Tax=Pedobacter sp. R-06 TaxID=3404051 RepID=UPI003CE9365D